MTDRESTLFERAMNLIALEHGHTRAEVLALLNDDSNFERVLIWPEPYEPPTPSPFIQVTRTSVVGPCVGGWGVRPDADVVGFKASPSANSPAQP